MLDVNEVEDAINRGIINHQTLITEEPESLSMTSDGSKSSYGTSKEVTSDGSLRSSCKVLTNNSINKEIKEDTPSTLFPLFLNKIVLS